MPLKPNEYRCAGCRRVFEKTKTDEEAYQEYIALYGANFDPTHETEVICDDCFSEMKPWLDEKLKPRNN